MKMTKEQYMVEFQKAYRENGLEVANILNHSALKEGLITIDTFHAAARILAEEIITR